MKIISYAITFLLFVVTTLTAQIVNVSFSGNGVTSFSSWSDINAFEYVGYGSFPGNQPWPAPITATEGLTTASLNRVAGAPTGGGPFLASESIYFGSFSQVPNALGGTLQIFDSAPLLNLKTLVFQIQIGEATGFDFHLPTGAPKLTVNDSLTLNATFVNLANRFQNGTFPSPQTGNDEPVYVNTWAYQWNIPSPTTLDFYTINFSPVTHAQVYNLRLDGTTFLQNSAVIPEPTTYGLLLLFAVGFVFYLINKKIIAG
jgi:hypothetical protein